MALLTTKTFINLIKSFDGEYTPGEIFKEFENKKIISKTKLEQRNENGVSLIRRRIRYMLYYLKNRGYIEQVGKSKYINSPKIHTYKHSKER